MKFKTLIKTPSWEWPPDAGETFQKTLLDVRADPADRLIAAELAGELLAMNDNVADTLLKIIQNTAKPEELRAKAAISLGPVLETGDTDGFEDPDATPIRETTFNKIRESLHKLYLDTTVPKQVRRRILEASVRAPMDWQTDAIRDAYASRDTEWMMTAVFGMRFVDGFDDQILEALNNPDPEIHFEAVNAAGNWEVDAAWPHVAALVADVNTPKPLLLAAIEAVANIRPGEALETLGDLLDSEDEEIAGAVEEALSMAAILDVDEDDEENAGEWIN